MLILDHSNFSDTVSKHDFIVVEFHFPMYFSKILATVYEKAASVLNSHDPPVILAKVVASDSEEVNKEIARQYKVIGYSTIKIFRRGGKIVQEYNGPLEADGMVAYLKKQAGPASTEIKSAEDASSVIDEKRVSIVGIFPEFSGEEFKNFLVLAENLCSHYDFGHTLDAQLLPRGDTQVTGPTLRLLKPFDELWVDFQNFEVDAMEKFVEEASTPLVISFDENPVRLGVLLGKFLFFSKEKAMQFLDFSNELTEAFKSKLKEVAALYKRKGVRFLVGDVKTEIGYFKDLGIKDDQVPALYIENSNGHKFLKPNLEPDHISPWLKEYMDGNLKPFIMSEPIPEINNEPVKVVVADSLRDMVLDSKKNVLLEIYEPWRRHTVKLAPILDEVAVSFENDADVVIAKLDKRKNDVPEDIFDDQGLTSMIFFKSARGKVMSYGGDRIKEDIIDFVQNNRDESEAFN